MKYNIQERVFLVKKYYESHNITSVQKAYRSNFKNSDAPSCSVIKNIISNFENTGSDTHVPPKRKNPDPKR